MDELLIQGLRAGELRFFDLQLAKQISAVNGEPVPELSLAVALVSYRLSCGDTCLALDKVAELGLFTHSDIESSLQNVPPLAQWRELLLKQKVVMDAAHEPESNGATDLSIAPLVLDKNNKLYLARYWFFEQSLLSALNRLVESKPPVVYSKLLLSSLQIIYGETKTTDWQRVATAAAVINRLCVITGGPGTGKTYTVAAILSALAAQKPGGDSPLVALAAPTGKAAARLTQSLQNSEILPAGYRHLEAQTLHRLLGLIPGRSNPGYHANNPLPFEVLIVDEASMIDLPMMTRLLEAVSEECRLVLLGDKDQLASVESGMVLGDICGARTGTRFSSDFCAKLDSLAGIQIKPVAGKNNPIADHIVYLDKSHRARDDSGIVALSRAINAGDVDECLDYFSSAEYPGLMLQPHTQAELERALLEVVVPLYEKIAAIEDPQQALESMTEACVLCALKRGRSGAQGVNQLMITLLQERGVISNEQPHYFGRPVMITENSASQKLFNGDYGICWNDNGALKIAFQGEAGLRTISPSRLPLHDTFYAMTIHKSQGSEYDSVVIVLPDEDSPLLTRELLYTAVTRARRRVTVIANKQQFASAVRSRSQRQSGIQNALWPVKESTIKPAPVAPGVVPVQIELDF